MTFTSPFARVALLLCAFAAHAPAAAQDSTRTPAKPPQPLGATVTISGSLQTQLSYAHDARVRPAAADRFGVGLKRARLRTQAQVGRSGVVVVLGETGESVGVRLLDVFMYHQFTSRWSVQAGRMISAVPRGGEITSTRDLDTVDRIAINDQWERGTIGSGSRDFGMDVRYSTPGLSAILALHNGDGSWATARGNFRESLGGADLTGGAGRTGMAATLFATYRLGAAEFGGFGGYSNAEAPATRAEGQAAGEGRAYATYGAHAYWGARPGSQPLRLKADALALRYETIPEARAGMPPQFRQHLFGAALLGALRVRTNAEMVARAEVWEDLHHEADHAVYLMAGPTVSLSALEGQAYGQRRIALMYGQQRERDRPTAHLAIVQLQLLF